MQQLASDQPNLLVRILRLLEELLDNLGRSREEINKAREYEATISRVQEALVKAGHEEMIEGERRYSNKRFSLGEIEGQKANYGIGVVLDSNIFDGVHPRKWGKILRDYVYKNLAGTDVVVYDEQGNPEHIYFANKNDRVRKNGSKNDHRVIDKLTQYHGDNVRSRAIVQLPEILEASRYKENNFAHDHQWLDENGWIIRTAYLEDPRGNIYEVTLNIADSRDRKILYDINRIHKIDIKKAPARLLSTDENQSSRHREQGIGWSQPEADSSINNNDTEVNRRYSLEEENDPGLQRAIEMQQEGYSPTDISNATGKVVMANGDIYSGIGGVLQYSPNNTQGGNIGGRGEQEAGRAGTYQGRADNQNEAGQGLGEEPGRSGNNDGRRNRADGGRVREEARGWEELSEDERQGFTQIIEQYMQAEPGSEQYLR